MGVIAIIGVAVGVIGVAGTVYTVYSGRRNQRKKLLVYEISDSIALAQAYSPEDDYKLSVLFERKGSTAEKIESVFTTFLKFANLGKEPIRGNDIAQSNPIKVNNVSLKNQVMGDEKTSVDVDFEFLDYQDGALIKILSVGDEGEISLAGDIIGMTEGIKNIDEIKSRIKTVENIANGWVVLGVEIAGLILSGFIFYWVTESWENVWLLLIPLGIALSLLVVLLWISDWSLPRGAPSFPRSLDLPRWCRAIPFYSISPRIMMRDELEAMKMEEKSDGIEGKTEGN